MGVIPLLLAIPRRNPHAPHFSAQRVCQPLMVAFLKYRLPQCFRPSDPEYWFQLTTGTGFFLLA
jgi:uncharacterized protein YllA (UPF0747 family)